MQNTVAAPIDTVSGAGGRGQVENMTAGTSGPMMAMPQAPLNGNPMMGTPQQTSPPTAVNNNQMINNPEEPQQFCLRWNSYPATVANELAALRASEELVDVTLACDGRHVKAHKVVLSACSPYFLQLFKSTPCKHPVIVLKDVGFDQLKSLLDFMYAGEVNVSQVELPSLLRTAETLQVRGLADTNPNKNNFQSPPKPTYPQNFASSSGMPGAQNSQETESVDDSNGNVCSSQDAANPSCDSSSAVNACSSNSGKRSQNSASGKNGEEEEDSNDSHEFDAIGVVDDHLKQDDYVTDGSLSQQFDDTGEVFPQNIGDSFDLSQGDLENDLMADENHTDEEVSEMDDDENSLDAKNFPGFPNDAAFDPGSLNDIGGTPNGGQAPMNPATSSHNLGNLPEPGNALMKADGLPNALLPPHPPGEGGRGRNRLARSLWPPGLPYHGPQQCPYCPRVLSNVGNWRKHVLTMHFAREKVYKCHLCTSSFRTSEYLQKHYVRVHNFPQKMTRKKGAEST